MARDNHPLHSPPQKIRRHQPNARNRIYIPCPECMRETYHDLVHTLSKKSPYISEVPDEHLYEFIQCRGCDSGSMIHRWGGEGTWDVNHYPSLVSRKPPRWIDQLREETIGGRNGIHLADILQEIYEAVAGRQYRLATMGIRALIEQVMIEKVTDQGSFSRNLDELHKAGYVSLVQRDNLSAILEAGHAAMHRLYKPEEADIETLLDVTASVLETVFIHPHTSSQVADRVPRRPGRSKTT